jgi:hypothetical protein
VSWIGSIFEWYIHWDVALLFCVGISQTDQLLVLTSSSPELEVPQPDWVHTVYDCLLLENSVNLSPDGVGGTYFISDENQRCIAVFKPVDEEPGALLNPKGKLKVPLMPGGGAIREVAAFLFDRNRFAGVPETLLIRDVCHAKFNNNHESQLITKTGSLQKFVHNIGNSDSMGSTGFSVIDVHSIGILDIRLLNLDRNGENILLVKDETNQIRLVPIDHSFTLPESLGDFYFEWQYWRQAKIPYTEETLQFIRDIDIDADSLLLERLGIPNQSIIYMRLSTLLLKKGAAAGLSLFEIACWIAPRKVTEVSQFTKLVDNAMRLNSPYTLDKIFEQLLDELLGSCVES